MSPTGVGFAFASLVAAREVWRWYAPRKRARLEARAACSASGHRWKETVPTTYGTVRECSRCRVQQHWSDTRKQWY
jgi:hypothetical protein